MPNESGGILHFNRGEVSPLALARIDIDRVRLSAATMVNWLPKTLGPMIKRPGSIYRGATASNAACNMAPFIAGTTDVALLEFTNGALRVWEGSPITPITFPNITNGINNTAFAAQGSWVITGSANGGTCAFGASGLQLQPGARGGLAKCTQEVTVTETGTEHCLIITIPRGYDPVMFRCGSSAGGDQYVEETRLLSGVHWLAFTPSGNFHLTFWAKDEYGAERRVTSCTLADNQVMSITAPWATANLDDIEYAQSADVVFVACKDVRPMRIERRTTRSWSVVDYYHPDGPFIGKTADLQIKASANEGRVTLTADANLFRDPEHVGSLFRLFHDGQSFTMKVAGDGVFTDPIRVSGIAAENYTERDFSITITGTWAGTLHFMRSIEGPDEGYGVYPRDHSAGTTEDMTGNATYNNEDEDDNLIVWYRVGFEDPDYTSGQASIAFTYQHGGNFGIVKVDAVASATSATAEVLRLVMATTYTAQWQEGLWNGQQGYPVGVAFFGGRLWWVSGATVAGSVSDDFESFDQENVNDDGPVIRTISEGPVDQINFILALDRLVLSTTGGEFMLRSSLERVLTPTDNEIVPIATEGSKDNFMAVRLDHEGVFVDRSGNRLIQLSPSGDGYQKADLNLLHPKILKNGSGVVSMAVMRRPDTRIFCVLSNGTCAVLTYDRAEEVIAWSRITIGQDSSAASTIERVVVLSDAGDDRVFFVVKRTINGGTVRYVEELAEEDLTDGDTECYLSDAAVHLTSLSSATTLTPGTYLQGESVVVWADGELLETADGTPATFTVDGSGQIDISAVLPAGCDEAVVGLSYTAQWKSMKLGTSLGRKKRQVKLGLLLKDTHRNGIQYGRDFTNMDLLNELYEGAEEDDDTIYSHYDQPRVPFPGDWGTDGRICLQSAGPYPATVLGLTHDAQVSG